MKILFMAALLIFSSFLFASEKVKNEVDHKQQFERCVAATSWLMQGKGLDDIDKKKSIEIPKGWYVVGTNVINGQPVFFICK